MRFRLSRHPLADRLRRRLAGAGLSPIRPGRRAGPPRAILLLVLGTLPGADLPPVTVLDGPFVEMSLPDTALAPRLELAALTNDRIAPLTDVDALQRKPRLALTRLIDATAAGPLPPLSAELTCLARAIYFEARGESVEGQLGVAQVVLNRLARDGYPKSLCGVVYEKRPGARTCQFTFACDRIADVPREDAAWRQAQAVAFVATARAWRDVTGEATHFHATYVAPSWGFQYAPTRLLGQHVFYREDGRTDPRRAADAAVSRTIGGRTIGGQTIGGRS